MAGVGQLLKLRVRAGLVKSRTCARDATEQYDKWPFLLEEVCDHLVAAYVILPEAPAVHDAEKSFFQTGLQCLRLSIQPTIDTE